MSWTERQQALLRGMGLRLWTPAAALAEPNAALERRPEPALAGAPAAVPASAAISAAPVPTAAANRPAAPGAASPAASPAPASAAPATVPAPQRDRPRSGDSAVAAMDWDTLAATVAACRACGLCETRRQTVFGVGHRRAQLMLVGEAPGEQEDQRGEPFVGAAGQLLDRMLHALGLSRGAADAGAPTADDAARQVYIANTLKCRPPGNRNPAPEELARCVPYLERQVALVQPRVILAMGRFAVQALLDTTEPLGKLRGRVHQWQGVPLVVTYHPAYLLRQPADKARAWADLCLAAQLLESSQQT